MISPLPSSSPFAFSSPLPFSSPLLLSSPLFFFPRPLPPLPPALEVTVSSRLSLGWVVVSPSARTQVSLLDAVIAGAELEVVDACASEFSQLLVLSVVMELLEAAKVDARRVGDSSLAGVEFSLEGLLNHELPRENKPAEGTKQTETKERGKSGAQLLQTERIVQKTKPRVTNKVKIILWIVSALPRETKQTLLSCLSFPSAVFLYHCTSTVYTSVLSMTTSKPLWTL